MSHGRHPVAPKSTSEGLPLARALSTTLSRASNGLPLGPRRGDSDRHTLPQRANVFLCRRFLLLLKHVLRQLILDLIELGAAAHVLVVLVEVLHLRIRDLDRLDDLLKMGLDDLLFGLVGGPAGVRGFPPGHIEEQLPGGDLFEQEETVLAQLILQLGRGARCSQPSDRSHSIGTIRSPEECHQEAWPTRQTSAHPKPVPDGRHQSCRRRLGRDGTLDTGRLRLRRRRIGGLLGTIGSTRIHSQDRRPIR